MCEVSAVLINKIKKKGFTAQDIKGKYPYELTDTFMGFHCGNTPSCKLCSDRAVKYQLIQHRLLEPKDSEPDFTRGTLEGDIAAGDITFIYHAPKEHPEPLSVFWMLNAVHGLTADLIPLLDPDDAALLCGQYDQDFPRWERLPVQKKVYEALKNKSRS